jgi:hypothetical protein
MGKIKKKIDEKYLRIPVYIYNFIKDNLTFIFIFPFLVFSYSSWLLAFYPGSFSPDSLDQWRQAVTGFYNNWHPYLYTYLIHLFSLIHKSPSTMLVFQIVLFSFVVSLFLNYLSKKGTNMGLIAFIAILLAVNPLIGYYNITLWKDVLYSILIIILGLMIYLYIREDKFRNPLWLIIISFVSVASMFIRHNGIINLILPGVMLLIFVLRDYKKILLFYLPSIVIFYLFFSSVLFNQLKVVPQIFGIDQPKIKIIGAIFKNNGKLTEEERNFFLQLMPEEEWKAKYSCDNSNDLFFTPFLKNKEVLKIDAFNIGNSDFYKKWKKYTMSAILANPVIAINDKICQTKFLTGFPTDRPPSNPLWYNNPIYEYKYSTLVGKNYVDPASMATNSKDLRLKDFYTDYLDLSFSEPYLRPFFWSTWMIIIFYLLITPLAILRKNFALLAYVWFILISIAFVAASSPAIDYRFSYFVYLSLFFTIVMLFTRELGSKELTNKKNEKN